LRSIVGEMTWSGDPDEFRARIDERMSGWPNLLPPTKWWKS
jgi:hypothetical protein